MLFRYLLLLLLTGLAPPMLAQTTLVGRVVDQKGQPLPGANVMLKGTYDGTTTDSSGAFRFKTARTDSATLVVSYIGYESAQKRLLLSQPTDNMVVRLRELANELNTVVITAGAFEASDSRRMTMLKPLDIVSTAGAGADITGVMQLLPGAQRVGEQEGLFVRGGSNLETNVVIDGMIVQNPFFSSLPDVSSRGRFQPFMFKGTSFSTGGYSAQYGQALSSVLLLNTTDKGSNNGVSLSLNLANTGISYDRANEKSSLSATGYYSNLTPLFALVRQTVDWTRAPENVGSSLTYRLKTGKAGMLKTYGMYSDGRVGMNFRDPTSGDGVTAIAIQNRNAFLTSTYTDSWSEGKWLLYTGLSYSRNSDLMTYDASNMSRSDERTQVRAVLTRLLGNRAGLTSSVLFGAEAHRLTLLNTVNGTPYRLNDTYLATFAESELYLTRLLAVRVGGRLEYNSVIGGVNVAPRLSMAYKTGTFSQVSLAAGQFYQTPDYRYLYRNKALGYERADHLILNYQIIKNGRT
ncbi:MAG: TonB-dependent receptor, partial [Bacteroidetes bacterium]|nr:TonB-dependent receptor [Fibrella sp.]